MRIVKKAAHAILRAMPLRWSRAIRLRFYTGRWPRVANPVGLNEKINWRILYDRRSIWNWTCDKLLSKEYAAQRSPGILLPEVLWVGNDVSELASLPIDGRWILKSNRSSKDVIVGSGPPDVAELAREIAEWNDFQWRDLGEWAYGSARNVLLLERWISDTVEPPMDYKVFVFDGIARFVEVHRDRFTDHHASIFTRDWVRVPATQTHRRADPHTMERPEQLEEILRRAEQIGAGFDFIRVDLYATDDGVWFGETTPYSWSGTRPYSPQSFEEEIGSYWTLPDLRSTT